MSHHGPQHPQQVRLRLPGGEQYALQVGAEELAGWLAPGRRARRESGLAPVRVEVTHAGGRAVIPLSAGELARCLSRARLAVEAEQPVGPQAVPDSTSGRGVHDPAAHRLGPNTDQPPDPKHRGPRRQRRVP